MAENNNSAAIELLFTVAGGTSTEGSSSGASIFSSLNGIIAQYNTKGDSVRKGINVNINVEYFRKQLKKLENITNAAEVTINPKMGDISEAQGAVKKQQDEINKGVRRQYSEEQEIVKELKERLGIYAKLRKFENRSYDQSKGDLSIGKMATTLSSRYGNGIKEEAEGLSSGAKKILQNAWDKMKYDVESGYSRDQYDTDEYKKLSRSAYLYVESEKAALEATGEYRQELLELADGFRDLFNEQMAASSLNDKYKDEIKGLVDLRHVFLDFDDFANIAAGSSEMMAGFGEGVEKSAESVKTLQEQLHLKGEIKWYTNQAVLKKMRDEAQKTLTEPGKNFKVNLGSDGQAKGERGSGLVYKQEAASSKNEIVFYQERSEALKESLNILNSLNLSMEDYEQILSVIMTNIAYDSEDKSAAAFLLTMTELNEQIKAQGQGLEDYADVRREAFEKYKNMGKDQGLLSANDIALLDKIAQSQGAVPFEGVERLDSSLADVLSDIEFLVEGRRKLALSEHDDIFENDTIPILAPLSELAKEDFKTPSLGVQILLDKVDNLAGRELTFKNIIDVLAKSRDALYTATSLATGDDMKKQLKAEAGSFENVINQIDRIESAYSGSKSTDWKKFYNASIKNETRAKGGKDESIYGDNSPLNEEHRSDMYRLLATEMEIINLRKEGRQINESETKIEKGQIENASELSAIYQTLKDKLVGCRDEYIALAEAGNARDKRGMLTQAAKDIDQKAADAMKEATGKVQELAGGEEARMSKVEAIRKGYEEQVKEAQAILNPLEEYYSTSMQILKNNVRAISLAGEKKRNEVEMAELEGSIYQQNKSQLDLELERETKLTQETSALRGKVADLGKAIDDYGYKLENSIYGDSDVVRGNFDYLIDRVNRYKDALNSGNKAMQIEAKKSFEMGVSTALNNGISSDFINNLRQYMIGLSQLYEKQAELTDLRTQITSMSGASMKDERVQAIKEREVMEASANTFLDYDEAVRKLISDYEVFRNANANGLISQKSYGESLRDLQKKVLKLRFEMNLLVGPPGKGLLAYDQFTALSNSLDMIMDNTPVVKGMENDFGKLDNTIKQLGIDAQEATEKAFFKITSELPTTMTELSELTKGFREEGKISTDVIKNATGKAAKFSEAIKGYEGGDYIRATASELREIGGDASRIQDMTRAYTKLVDEARHGAAVLSRADISMKPAEDGTVRNIDSIKNAYGNLQKQIKNLRTEDDINAVVDSINKLLTELKNPDLEGKDISTMTTRLSNMKQSVLSLKGSGAVFADMVGRIEILNDKLQNSPEWVKGLFGDLQNMSAEVKTFTQNDIRYGEGVQQVIYDAIKLGDSVGNGADAAAQKLDDILKKIPEITSKYPYLNEGVNLKTGVNDSDRYIEALDNVKEKIGEIPTTYKEVRAIMPNGVIPDEWIVNLEEFKKSLKNAIGGKGTFADAQNNLNNFLSAVPRGSLTANLRNLLQPFDGLLDVLKTGDPLVVTFKGDMEKLDELMVDFPDTFETVKAAFVGEGKNLSPRGDYRVGIWTDQMNQIEQSIAKATSGKGSFTAARIAVESFYNSLGHTDEANKIKEFLGPFDAVISRLEQGERDVNDFSTDISRVYAEVLKLENPEAKFAPEFFKDIAVDANNLEAGLSGIAGSFTVMDAASVGITKDIRDWARSTDECEISVKAAADLQDSVKTWMNKAIAAQKSGDQATAKFAGIMTNLFQNRYENLVEQLSMLDENGELRATAEELANLQGQLNFQNVEINTKETDASAKAFVSGFKKAKSAVEQFLVAYKKYSDTGDEMQYKADKEAIEKTFAVFTNKGTGQYLGSERERLDTMFDNGTKDFLNSMLENGKQRIDTEKQENEQLDATKTKLKSLMEDTKELTSLREKEAKSGNKGKYSDEIQALEESIKDEVYKEDENGMNLLKKSINEYANAIPGQKSQKMTEQLSEQLKLIKETVPLEGESTNESIKKLSALNEMDGLMERLKSSSADIEKYSASPDKHPKALKKAVKIEKETNNTILDRINTLEKEETISHKYAETLRQQKKNINDAHQIKMDDLKVEQDAKSAKEQKTSAQKEQREALIEQKEELQEIRNTIAQVIKEENEYVNALKNGKKAAADLWKERLKQDAGDNGDAQFAIDAYKSKWNVGTNDDKELEVLQKALLDSYDTAAANEKDAIATSKRSAAVGKLNDKMSELMNVSNSLIHLTGKEDDWPNRIASAKERQDELTKSIEMTLLSLKRLGYLTDEQIQGYEKRIADEQKLASDTEKDIRLRQERNQAEAQSVEIEKQVTAITKKYDAKLKDIADRQNRIDNFKAKYGKNDFTSEEQASIDFNLKTVYSAITDELNKLNIAEEDREKIIEKLQFYYNGLIAKNKESLKYREEEIKVSNAQKKVNTAYKDGESVIKAYFSLATRNFKNQKNGVSISETLAGAYRDAASEYQIFADTFKDNKNLTEDQKKSLQELIDTQEREFEILKEKESEKEAERREKLADSYEKNRAKLANTLAQNKDLRRFDKEWFDEMWEIANTPLEFANIDKAWDEVENKLKEFEQELPELAKDLKELQGKGVNNESLATFMEKWGSMGEFIHGTTDKISKSMKDMLINNGFRSISDSLEMAKIKQDEYNERIGATINSFKEMIRLAEHPVDSEFYTNIKRDSLGIIQSNERVADMFKDLDKAMADPHASQDGVQTVLNKYKDVFDEANRVQQMLDKVRQSATNGAMPGGVDALREEFSDLGANPEVSKFFDELSLLNWDGGADTDAVEYTISKYKSFWDVLNNVYESMLRLTGMSRGLTLGEDRLAITEGRNLSLREFDELETLLIKLGGSQDTVKEKINEFRTLVGTPLNSDIFLTLVNETRDAISETQKFMADFRGLSQEIGNIDVSNLEKYRFSGKAKELQDKFLNDLRNANPGETEAIVDEYKEYFEIIGEGENAAVQSMFAKVEKKINDGKTAVANAIANNAELRATDTNLDAFFTELENASFGEYQGIIDSFIAEIDEGEIKLAQGSREKAYLSIINDLNKGTNTGATGRILTYRDIDDFSAACDKAGIKSEELKTAISSLYHVAGDKINSDGVRGIFDSIDRTINRGKILSGTLTDIFQSLGGDAEVMKYATGESEKTKKNLEELLRRLQDQRKIYLETRPKRPKGAKKTQPTSPAMDALDSQIQETEGKIKALEEEIERSEFTPEIGTSVAEEISGLLNSESFKMAEELSPTVKEFGEKLYNALWEDSADPKKISSIVVEYKEKFKELGLLVEDSVVNPLRSLKNLSIASSMEMFSLRDFNYIKEGCGDAGAATDLLKAKFDELHEKIGEKLSSDNIKEYVAELDRELGGNEKARVESFFNELASNPKAVFDVGQRAKLTGTDEGGYGDLIANNSVLKNMYGEIMQGIKNNADEQAVQAIIDKYQVYLEKIGAVKKNLQELQQYSTMGGGEYTANLINVDDINKLSESIRSLGLSEEDTKRLLDELAGQLGHRITDPGFREIADELKGLYANTGRFDELYAKIQDLTSKPFNLESYKALKEEFADVLAIDEDLNSAFGKMDKNLSEPISPKMFEDVYKKLADANGEIDGFEESAKVLKDAFDKGEITFDSLDKLEDVLKNSKVEISAATEVARIFKEELEKDISTSALEGYVDSIKDKTVEASLYTAQLAEGTNTFFNKIGKAFNTNVVQKISSMIMMSLTKAVKNVYTNIKELETALAQLQIVTKDTSVTTTEFANSVTNTAHKVATSVSSLTESITTYARLGFSLNEATKFAELTAQYSKVANVDVSSATTNITGIIKAFGISVNQLEGVLDELITVGNNFAISSDELGEGLNNAAAALVANGNSLEQSLGILAAANATVQDVSRASTAVRTVAARLSNSTSELEELGEDTSELISTPALAKEMEAFGIAITDVNGNLLSTYDILGQVAEKWDTYSNTAQASIAKLLAGTRQQSVFYSIIQNWDDAKEAVEACDDATGELTDSYGIYVDTIEGRMNQLSASWESFSERLLDSTVVKGLIQMADGLVEALSWLVKGFNDMGVTVIAIIVMIVAAIMKKLFPSMGNLVKKIQEIQLQAKKMGKTFTQRIGDMVKGFMTAEKEVTKVSKQMVDGQEQMVESTETVTTLSTAGITSILAIFSLLSSVLNRINDLADGWGSFATMMVALIGVIVMAVVLGMKKIQSSTGAIMIIITMALTLIISLVNFIQAMSQKAQKAAEKAREAADEQIEALEDLNDQLEDAKDNLDDLNDRYDELLKKRAQGTLTTTEENEILALREEISKAEAEAEQAQEAVDIQTVVTQQAAAEAIDKMLDLDVHYEKEVLGYSYWTRAGKEGFDENSDNYDEALSKMYEEGVLKGTYDFSKDFKGNTKNIMNFMLENYDILSTDEKKWLSEQFGTIQEYADQLEYHSEVAGIKSGTAAYEALSNEEKELVKINESYLEYMEMLDKYTIAISDNGASKVYSSMLDRQMYSDASAIIKAFAKIEQMEGEELNKLAKDMGYDAQWFREYIANATDDEMKKLAKQMEMSVEELIESFEDMSDEVAQEYASAMYKIEMAAQFDDVMMNTQAMQDFISYLQKLNVIGEDLNQSYFDWATSTGSLTLTDDEKKFFREFSKMTGQQVEDLLEDEDALEKYGNAIDLFLSLFEDTTGNGDWSALTNQDYAKSLFLNTSVISDLETYEVGFSAMVDDVADTFSTLSDALDDITDTGVVAADTMQDILSDYRDLLDYFDLDEDLQGYVLKDEFADWDMTDIMEDYFIKYIDTYGEQYNNVLKEYNQAIEDVAEAQRTLEAAEEGSEEYEQALTDWAEAVGILGEKETELTYAQNNLTMAQQVSATELRKAELDKITDELDAQTDALEDQLDAYQDLIDIRKELLESYQDEISYQKELAEKTTSVSDLETQLAVAKLDNSAAGLARQRELQSELDSAREELDDFTLENAVDRITNQLDKESDEFEKVINKQTEDLENKADELVNNLKILFSLNYDEDTGEYTGATAETKYHTGGFVGNELNGNEEFAKLLKGEFVATPAMMENFMDTTLPGIANAAANSKHQGNVFNSPLITLTCEGITTESVPDVEKIVKKATEEIKKQLDSGFSRAGRKTKSLNLSL